jgi:hypothetical protein
VYKPIFCLQEITKILELLPAASLLPARPRVKDWAGVPHGTEGVGYVELPEYMSRETSEAGGSGSRVAW